MTVLKRLLIRRTKAGAPVWFHALKETAEFYGWDKHFEEYVEGLQIDSEGRRFLIPTGLSTRRTKGGQSIQISRAPSKNGTMAGKCNKIRVAGQLRFRDLCEIAKATDVDWHWMQSFNGTRYSRADWLKFHDAYLDGREGEVVPRKARLRAKPRTTPLDRLSPGHCKDFRDRELIAAYQETLLPKTR